MGCTDALLHGALALYSRCVLSLCTLAVYSRCVHILAGSTHLLRTRYVDTPQGCIRAASAGLHQLGCMLGRVSCRVRSGLTRGCLQTIEGHSRHGPCCRKAGTTWLAATPLEHVLQ